MSNGNRDKTQSGANALDEILRGFQNFGTQAWSAATGQPPVNLLDLLTATPDHLVRLGEAGHYLKDLREVAGLTLEELAEALDLDNPRTLEAIEEGRSPVNLDILYRLGAFHARHDPVGFMLDYSREHAPLLWQVLTLSGLDQLLASAGRELRFLNLYRARDRARKLSDDEFERLLDFVGGTLDLALDFSAGPRQSPTPRKAPPHRGAKSSQGKGKSQGSGARNKKDAG